MKKNKFKVSMLAIIPFLILVTMFLLIPIINMVRQSFISPDNKGLTLSNYITIFTKKYYLIAIINSLMVSFLSSFIGIIVSFIGAFAATNLKAKGRKLFTTILNMVSNFAGVPLAFAFMVLLGEVGIFVSFAKANGIDFLADFRLYSMTGLSMIYIYFQIPLATLLLLPAFAGVREEWKEAAMVLKASKLQFWTKVGIPVLMPSIIGTVSILFTNALSAYASAYALIGTNYPLMTVRISAMFTGDVVQQVELGSALSTVLATFMAVAIIINTNMTSKARKGM